VVVLGTSALVEADLVASLVEVVAPLVEVVLAAAGNSSNPIQISKHYYIKKAPTL